MSNISPRLNAAEVRQAQRAGYLVPAGRKQIFGSMFSWFPSIRFGRPTFWPVGANAKPPINAAESSSGQIVTPATALTVSAFWACVWLNARVLASLPLELKRYKAGGGRGTPEMSDPLFDVLRWRPNASMTAYAFWTAMWASEMVWGAGFAKKHMNGGKIVALEFLLPQYMTVYQKNGKGPVRFRYDSPLDPQDFSADEIFHLFTRSLDGLTGCSVIEFARHSLGIAQSGENAAGKIFRKGMNATGFIKVDKFLKPSQREDFRQEIEEFAGDGPKAGGTMVLEGGTDYKQLSMKPQDAELLQSRQFSVEDVCRWLNTPPILIGHSSQGQTMWGSGIEQIFAGWARLSLRPFTTTATQTIRAFLIAPADRNELLAEYDLDDLLAADSQARAAFYSTLAQNGIKTRNELREKEGDGPMEGGDVLTVQSNLVPLAQMGAAANDPAAAAGTSAAQKLRNALLELLAIDQPPAKPEGKP